MEGSDTASTDAHIELLTEHFGFNPKGFIDKLVYAANEHLYFLAENFEQSLVQAANASSAQGSQESEQILAAEKSTHKVLTLFENALDHMYDTIELWTLVHVFGITQEQAQNITLAHHRGLHLRQTGEARSAFAREQQLSRLELRLLAKLEQARSTSVVLDRAISAATARLSRAESLEEHFAFVLRTAANDNSLRSIEVDTLKKVRADASAVCTDVSVLRDLDPLGKTLGSRAVKNTDGRDFDGSNRDAYLYWEVNRALSEQHKAVDKAGAASDRKEKAAKVGPPGRQPKGGSKRAALEGADPGAEGMDKRRQL